MNKTAATWIVLAIIILIIVAIYWFYATQYSNQETTLTPGQNQEPANTIQLGSTAALGPFLTDTNGRTLYYFANDTAQKSNCTGQCLVLWPPFSVSNVTVPADLRAADFGQITTASGTNQITYKGWPLYYYSGDQAKGETKGQGLQDIWFIAPVPFYNILLMNNPQKRLYLSDVNGRALYTYKNDAKGTATNDPESKCEGTCLTNWEIFNQQQVVFPSLLKGTDFKSFTRTDGQTQLSYKGSPLYLYDGDVQSGDVKGDNLNNLWTLVKP